MEKTLINKTKKVIIFGFTFFKPLVSEFKSPLTSNIVTAISETTITAKGSNNLKLLIDSPKINRIPSLLKCFLRL